MAAINNAQSESPAMKVVVICKPPDDNGTASSDACDTSCLQVENKHISAKRPGSSAAMKQFGPFQLCSSAGAIPLFYDCCAGDIMNALQRGTSYGVITYGGVGNGKTTCMWGSLGGLPAEDAIVPTVCGQLFSIIQATAAPTDEVLVTSSFLRVSAISEFQDDCLVKDTSNSGKGLRVREAIGPQHPPWGEFYIEGLTKRHCPDVAALTDAALSGLEQAEIMDREHESLKRGARSHKLFTIEVKRRNNAGDLLQSTLHFLDTVGVERPSVTTKTASKAFGGKSAAERRRDMLAKKEAKKEDPTTKAIIRVVDSLASQSTHIPFRDSKLTRLCKGVLGGCGQSWCGLIVGCVLNTTSAFGESEAMLQFLQKTSQSLGVASTAMAPFVLNASSTIAARKPRTDELAVRFFGKPSDNLHPSDVHCDMDSPPEMAELRNLLADREQLRADPFEVVRRSTSAE